MIKSFGPSGYRDKDGVLRLSCVSSQTYCFLLHGRMCSDQKPPREVENPRETPEWCKYAAGMREDILEMEDFDRMGLADMTRAELMPLMKEHVRTEGSQAHGRPWYGGQSDNAW